VTLTRHARIYRFPTSNFYFGQLFNFFINAAPIYAEIEIPDTIKTHVDKIIFWNQRLVPMINNKLVELRSNFNSYIKKQYLGMHLWFNCIKPIVE